MTLRILINGAKGKMGSLACEVINKNPKFTLLQGLTRSDNLNQAIREHSPNIVIDLTTADSVYENTLTIINAGVHPVIGTSGLLPEQIEYFKELSAKKKLGGIIVPNFSIAAVLMMKFAVMAAEYYPHVEIIEGHHLQKKDAPSGTAIKTAQMLANVTPHEETACRELIPGARGANLANIPIHSLRLPGILAKQEVIFGGEGETLSITHQSLDRNSFMPGLVLACERVSNLDKLFYGLDNLLFS